MSKMTYQWILGGISNDRPILKYCHNCGRKVSFRDSMKRRHNANGKKIFEYAIYKCERYHTWNLLLNTYKAGENIKFSELEVQTVGIGDFDSIHLSEHRGGDIEKIDIFLEEINGRWRVDKLLGDRIADVSRTEICELIRQGKILLDGKEVKQNAILKSQQTITIIL